MMQHKFIFSSLLFTLISLPRAQAQSESTSVFNFLSLPTSAHGMALGGRNFSMPDDDASLLFHNPALMSDASNRAINLGFMSYMQGSRAGNAAVTLAHGDRGTWGFGAQFVSYGSMKETTVDGVEMGDFSALDLALMGGYSYALTEHVAGGVTGKFIYSHYGEFTSIALAVDLGLNYYNEDQGLSLSAVVANLGGQVQSFADHREHLPIDLRIGMTKELEGAPFRFSVSMVDLTHWDASDYYSTDGEISKGRIFTNHFILGADILLSRQLTASVGYNLRRAYELTAAGAAHGAGLSCGVNLHLKRFKVGVAYAKYHVSIPAYMVTAQYTL